MCGRTREHLCAPLLLAGQDNFVAGYLLPVLDRPATGWDIEQLWLKAAHGAGQHEGLFARSMQSDYRWGGKPEAMAMPRCRRRPEARAVPALLQFLPRVGSRLCGSAPAVANSHSRRDRRRSRHRNAGLTRHGTALHRQLPQPTRQGLCRPLPFPLCLRRQSGPLACHRNRCARAGHRSQQLRQWRKPEARRTGKG